LQGALARVDNAIVYEGLDDVFEIAAKYAASIANAHALSDANKRTGLAVA
jgi:death-on-curing protein